MEAKQLIVPCVHLNGTGKASLLGEYDKSYDKLAEAFDTMRKSPPNGRDYYPYGGDYLKTAMEQHQARLGVVRDLMKEIEAVMTGIADNKKFVTVEPD